MLFVCRISRLPPPTLTKTAETIPFSCPNKSLCNFLFDSPDHLIKDIKDNQGQPEMTVVQVEKGTFGHLDQFIQGYRRLTLTN